MNTLACYNSSDEYMKDWGGHNWYDDETCLAPSVGYIVNDEQIKYYQQRKRLNVPTNQFWYKSKNNKIIPPANPDGFIGADDKPLSILSHEYNVELKLNVITLSDTLCGFGDNLFYYGRQQYLDFYEVYMPDSVTFIGYQSFRCTGWGRDVKGVYFQFSNNLKSIGYLAFVDMGLNDVWFPDSLNSVGEKCFIWTSINRMRLPNNPNFTFGEQAFLTVGLFQYVDIPEGVEVIPKYCFMIQSGYEHVPTLKSIKLPTTLKTLETAAFYNQTKLESIVIPEGITIISDSAFYNCTSLEHVELPSGLVTIVDWAFSGIKISTIALPERLEFIGYASFYNNAYLTSITLPASLTTIGEWAISYCPLLENIVFEGTMEQWNAITKGADWNTKTPATVVHCTDGDVELVQAATYSLERPTLDLKPVVL